MRHRLVLPLIILFGIGLWLPMMPQPVSPALASVWQEKVDPWVLETAVNAPTEFIVFLTEQADLSALLDTFTLKIRIAVMRLECLVAIDYDQ